MSSKVQRSKRALKSRSIAAKSNRIRLVVGRSNQHIYAQIISNDGAKVLAGSSTLSSEASGIKGSNVQGAEWVGKSIAEKAVTLGIKEVAFDRSGFRYHGRVKALAEAARTAGLVF
ncbi:MAG: 50S ribosomal protein L18 [Pseudomonadota bacterium]